MDISKYMHMLWFWRRDSSGTDRNVVKVPSWLIGSISIPVWSNLHHSVKSCVQTPLSRELRNTISSPWGPFTTSQQLRSKTTVMGSYNPGAHQYFSLIFQISGGSQMKTEEEL